MSRYRRYWYGFVKRTLYEYHKGFRDAEPSSDQTMIAIAAIELSESEVLQQPDGDLKLKVIYDILYKNAVTYEGAEVRHYVSARTARRWCTAYIHRVGKHMGF